MSQRVKGISNNDAREVALFQEYLNDKKLLTTEAFFRKYQDYMNLSDKEVARILKSSPAPAPDALLELLTKLQGGLRRLYPHIHDAGMTGESNFELAWLNIESLMPELDAEIQRIAERKK